MTTGDVLTGRRRDGNTGRRVPPWSWKQARSGRSYCLICACPIRWVDGEATHDTTPQGHPPSVPWQRGYRRHDAIPATLEYRGAGVSFERKRRRRYPPAEGK